MAKLFENWPEVLRFELVSECQQFLADERLDLVPRCRIVQVALCFFIVIPILFLTFRLSFFLPFFFFSLIKIRTIFVPGICILLYHFVREPTCEHNGKIVEKGSVEGNTHDFVMPFFLRFSEDALLYTTLHSR